MANENYTEKMIVYLRKNIKKGYTKESLRQALLQQGHSKSEIDRAIKKVEQELVASAPVLKAKPQNTKFDIDSVNIEPEEKKPFWKRIFG